MPIPTEWTEALCVGVDALDDDMRILLGVLNQLGQAVVEETAADVVASLVIFFCNHARTHFRREENLLEHLGYSGQESHRARHQEFVRWIETFRHLYGVTHGKMPSQMLAFPAGWLIEHTLGEGKKCQPFLAGRKAKVENVLEAMDAFALYGFDDQTNDPLREAEEAALISKD